MNSVNLDMLDFKKTGGLIPVVVQDSRNQEVLMVAFANQEAVQKTLETGYAHFFSRSRSQLWRKGDTSGHVQKINRILVDCDNDTLIYQVEQTGVACHLGTRTCFTHTLIP